MSRTLKDLLDEMEKNIGNKKDNQYLVDKIKKADPVLVMAFMYKLYMQRKELIEIVKGMSDERVKHYEKKLLRYVNKGKLARREQEKFSKWLKRIKEMEIELTSNPSGK